MTKASSSKSQNDSLDVREDWLLAAIEMLRPHFAETEWPLPPVIHISTSFPLARSIGENRNIRAQTLASFANDDDNLSIYLSPFEKETVQVVLVLVHELCHVALDNEDGHRGRFAKLAKQIGLEPPLLSLHASVKLTEQAALIAQWLGPYPHAGLDRLAKILDGEPVPPDSGPVATGPRRWNSGPPRQTNRMIRCVCQAPDCGYTMRVARSWIEKAIPVCPIHLSPASVEGRT